MEFGAIVAIPWYETEGDYLAVVAMLPASERQDPFTHDVFMGKMKRKEQELKSRGVIPIRVPIDAITVKEWCDSNNLAVCRQSITEYASVCAALIHKRDEGRN